MNKSAAKKGPGWVPVIVGAICLGVIGVLIFPLFAQGIPRTQRSVSLSNIKQCALGIQMYADDFDGMFPYVENMPMLVKVTRPYIRNDATWDTLNLSRPGQFDFNRSLAGVRFGEVVNPAETPMLFDPIAFVPSTGNTGSASFLIAFVDGHAMYRSEKRWIEAQPLLRLKLKKHGLPLK
jgi:hypothetical protein